VAISPSERGKGIGTAFMNELFIKVVPRGDSVYMATQLKSNVRFYERIGFSTYKDTVESVGEGKDKVKFDNWFMSLNTTDFGR
jgi:GNAT superfamily N-acetyltransferase